MAAVWAAFLGFWVLGALGSYIGLLVFFIWAFFIVEKENFTAGMFELVLCFIFIQFMARVDIWGYFVSDMSILGFGISAPFSSSLRLIVYLLIGLGWSFVKWFIYVKERADKLKLKRDEYFRAHTGSDVEERWKSDLPYGLRRPVAMDHKGGISIWVIYWPFSLIWSFLNNFLKQLVRQIVASFRKWYQGIADRAYRGLD